MIRPITSKFPGVGPHFSSGRCHSCSSHNLTGSTLEMGEDEVWQEIDCEDCGANRTEHYRLVMATTIDPDNDEEIVLWAKDRGKVY